MADENKARIFADGIEVRCAYDKLVKVEELILHPKNPNTHPQNQIKILAQNICYHGWHHPIVVSKLSGYIVTGYGRLEATREHDVSIVPVEYQDFATEDNELAVLVGDNRLAELSTLDLNGLQDIIDGCLIFMNSFPIYGICLIGLLGRYLIIYFYSHTLLLF